MTAGLPNPATQDLGGQDNIQHNHAADMDPRTWSPRIRDRYALGTSRKRRAASVAGAFALLLAPVGVWGFWQAGRSDVSAAIGPYALTATSAQVEMTYQSNGPAMVTCAIRAQDAQRVDVGFAYVRLPGTNGSSRTVTYTLATRAPAVAAELLGCQPGDDISRLPAAQFPPGVKPPAQLPPGYAPSASGATSGTA